MQIKVIELPELKMLGLGTRFTSILGDSPPVKNSIPELWNELFERVPQINARRGEVFFGLCEALPPSEKPERNELLYIAAVEVSEFTWLPQGMLRRTVPAAKHIVVNHRGPISQIGHTMKVAYSWLPKQPEYSMRELPPLEVYDHRFKGDAADSEMDIYIPIR